MPTYQAAALTPTLPATMTRDYLAEPAPIAPVLPTFVRAYGTAVEAPALGGGEGGTPTVGPRPTVGMLWPRAR